MPPGPWYNVSLRAKLTPQIITDILHHSNLSPTLRYQSGERLLSQRNIEDGTRLMAQAWAEKANTPMLPSSRSSTWPPKKADSLDQLPLNGWLTHKNQLYQAAKPEAPLTDGGLETNLKLHRLKPSDLFGVTD